MYDLYVSDEELQRVLAREYGQILVTAEGSPVPAFVHPYVTFEEIDARVASPMEWTTDWKKVGETGKIGLDDLKSFASWDTYFRSGDKGVFMVNLGRDPVKDWIFQHIDVALHVQGMLDARGVMTWKRAEMKNGVLYVYFTTGIAPLAILAIIVGAALAIAFIIVSVGLYQVQQKKVDLYVEQEKVVQDKLMEEISELPDPQARILALEKRSSELSRIYSTESSTDIFKPVTGAVTTLVIVAGILLLLPVVLRMVVK